MFVEEELFVIPDSDRFVLYAPLKRAAVAVTGGVVRDLQSCEVSGIFPPGSVCADLLRAGILMESAPPKPAPVAALTLFKPTSVTLFTTSDCGLRCIYCYASAGLTAKAMELPVAQAAIDLIVDNAVALNKKSINVSFHGGGEPLYGASGLLVSNIVHYANNLAISRGLRVSFACATNGVLSLRQLAWAADNLNRLNLSVDGPPEIQDAQRPLKTGGPSSSFIERTLAILEERQLDYGIRVTVTRLSVERLTDIVAYLHRVAPSAGVHLEPLFSCGRCATTGAEAPGADEFVAAFISAKSYAKEVGASVYNSGASMERCGEYFCGAASGNFCVTPWGAVTSCYEVSLPSDERASAFFFGEYDYDLRTFRFNTEQLAKLRERRVSQIATCKDCFMKYACSGDCPAKSMSITGSLTGGFRCDENRQLGAHDIVERIVPAVRDYSLKGSDACQQQP